ncbi:hypothetical protein LFL97_24735 [Burkholderia sp. JSH-S8]|nr:hypothetical protein LFL97_24735 [Burkholderia sp. JSH-S8]
MDDLPDKLRRNVVVLSATIVAIAFFHLLLQFVNCKHETSTVCERSVTSAMMSGEGHE